MHNKTPAPIRVLVVDDDPSVSNIMAEMLRIEGYEPITCLDPLKAIEIAKRELPDLAFIDINMPGMDGLQVATILKEHTPGCEIVIMTGYGTFDNAVQAIKVGVQDYLTKPFHRSQLAFCLNRFRERRAIKERMRLAEERYFDLVQNIPLFIYVMRKDFQLDFASRGCKGIFGYTPEEAVNDPKWFSNRIYPEDRTRVLCLFDQAFDTFGESLSVECRFLHKKGHVIYSLVQTIPFADSEGQRNSPSLQGIVVNITDRVFLERALVQKEKLKTLGAISAEVAHEIRNPLVSIGGFARRLQKNHPDSPEASIILRECQRLEKLLNKIRNYLRPVEVHYREYFVNDLILDSLDLLSPEIGQRQVDPHLDEELSSVFVDSEVLQQVFINLIRNALEGMQPGGTVTIRSFESNDHIHVEFKNVSPRAKAIDPESLFLPFDEGGQSIGLPLCYRLVKNMGGLLSFLQEGNHAIFTVSLPKCRLSEKEQETPRHQNGNSLDA